MKDTCTLDVADRGGATLDVIGKLMGMTRERIRQIAEVALKKLRKGLLEAYEIDEKELGPEVAEEIFWFLVTD